MHTLLAGQHAGACRQHWLILLLMAAAQGRHSTAALEPRMSPPHSR